MASLSSVSRVGVRELSRAGGRDTWWLGSVALFVVFALNFGAFRVFGDGTQYYSFVQRLFGDRSDATGYNFGVGLMNAPFYGVARLVQAAGVSSFGGHSLTAASITVSSIFWVVVAASASAWLLAKLELRHRALAVGASVFGTPVWYYGSFSPSYSHAADAGAFSLASVGLYHLVTRGGLRSCVVAGAAFALSVAVRPFNAGALAGALIALVAYGRRRRRRCERRRAVCRRRRAR